MTLPNLLTVFRIILIPVFVLLLVYDARVYALAIFLLTCLSDLLDGYIARTWQQQTILGTFLDPIADKLLMVTTFVTLALLGALPLPLTVVLVTRDVALSLILGIVLFTTGRRLEGPTFLGRAALFCQMATVVLGLIFHVFESHTVFETLRPFILYPVFVTTGMLAVIAGLHYAYQVVRLRQKVEAPLGKQMPVQ
jgi:cardiolipin synthase